ncbi:hypothetical protein FQA39_LY11667 [Lamprigera yunnana]|nr:hypothetical protein FQA39_LY11667 [Lamprigera yunnana]
MELGRRRNQEEVQRNKGKNNEGNRKKISVKGKTQDRVARFQLPGIRSLGETMQETENEQDVFTMREVGQDAKWCERETKCYVCRTEGHRADSLKCKKFREADGSAGAHRAHRAVIRNEHRSGCRAQQKTDLTGREGLDSERQGRRGGRSQPVRVNSEVFGNLRLRLATVDFFEMSGHTMVRGPSQFHRVDSEVFGNVPLRLRMVDLFEVSRRSMSLRITQLVRVHSEMFGHGCVRFAMVDFFEISRHTMGLGPSQLVLVNSEVFGDVRLRFATDDLFKASCRSMGLHISQHVRVH